MKKFVAGNRIYYNTVFINRSSRSTTYTGHNLATLEADKCKNTIRIMDMKLIYVNVISANVD